MRALKYVITFAIGAACGASGTWFGVKKFYKKKYEKDVSEERKLFHSLTKEYRANHDKKKENDISEESGLKSTKVDREEKKSYEDLVKDLNYSCNDVMTIYNIRKSDFDETPTEKQMWLMWFAKEKILCNANSGRVYTELEDILGPEGIEALNEAGEDYDTENFYVQNDFLNLTFCVQIEIEETYEMIFGDSSGG